MCSNYVIKYDIEIDIKIVNCIIFGKNQSANMTDLRVNACNYQKSLDRHLDNLVKWNIINDEKPSANGKARKITLKMDYGDAMSELMRLKSAIDTVNEFFVS